MANKQTSEKTGLELLRVPFPEHHISKLPKPTIANDEWKKLPKSKCLECGGYHPTTKTIHLNYVGHAALTDRLLDCDPNWSWEPLAIGQDGYPVVDKDGGMWIKLTVCGITRLGYGDAQGKTGGNATKERIGDALRNAAMRFGAALELWHKGELHMDDEDSPPYTPTKTGTTRHANPGNGDGLPEASKLKVMQAVGEVQSLMKQDKEFDAYEAKQAAELDADETVYFWSHFDSKQRSALKSIHDSLQKTYGADKLDA